MKYMFWTAAGLMVFLRNDAVISEDAAYLASVIWLIAGCWVFDKVFEW